MEILKAKSELSVYRGHPWSHIQVDMILEGLIMDFTCVHVQLIFIDLSP
jgi:hypothetical protein